MDTTRRKRKPLPLMAWLSCVLIGSSAAIGIDAGTWVTPRDSYESYYWGPTTVVTPADWDRRLLP